MARRYAFGYREIEDLLGGGQYENGSVLAGTVSLIAVYVLSRAGRQAGVRACMRMCMRMLLFFGSLDAPHALSLTHTHTHTHSQRIPETRSR